MAYMLLLRITVIIPNQNIVSIYEKKQLPTKCTFQLALYCHYNIRTEHLRLSLGFDQSTVTIPNDAKHVP